MKPMTFSPKPDGVVFYRGPSMLDGKPIVAIATGLRRGSENTKKTGDMVQTYILREDIAPTDAVHSGEDVSICGDCPLRGSVKDGQNQERACYVTVFMGPQTVWKSVPSGELPECRGSFPDLCLQISARWRVWRSSGGPVVHLASGPEPEQKGIRDTRINGGNSQSLRRLSWRRLSPGKTRGLRKATGSERSASQRARRDRSVTRMSLSARPRMKCPTRSSARIVARAAAKRRRNSQRGHSRSWQHRKNQRLSGIGLTIVKRRNES